MAWKEFMGDVHIALEGSLDRQSHIFRLLGGKLAQLGVHMIQVQQRDLLVENLRQNVDTNVKLASLAELDVFVAELFVVSLEQHDLSEDLVGKGA